MTWNEAQHESVFAQLVGRGQELRVLWQYEGEVLRVLGQDALKNMQRKLVWIYWLDILRRMCFISSAVHRTVCSFLCSLKQYQNIEHSCIHTR